MAIVRLLAGLLLIAYDAFAAYAGSASIPSVSLLRIFRAYKTGVLRVRTDDVSANWFCHYKLVPTKESVDGIGRLLSEESAKGLTCQPDGGTLWNPQNALVTVIKEQIRMNAPYPWIFLAKYAVFRALLYRGLSPSEAQMIKSIFLKSNKDGIFSDKLKQLINSLASARCHEDLLVALATNFDVIGMCEALLDSDAQHIGAIPRLVKEGCMESRGKTLRIPFELLPYLDDETKYELVKTGAIPASLLSPIDHCSLYIMSKFSSRPSANVRKKCIRANSHLASHEEEALEVNSALLIKMGCFDLTIFPRDLWIKILLYCGNFLFQIYTIPTVCKCWKDLHHIVLSRSLMVHKMFIGALEDDHAMRTTLWGDFSNFATCNILDRELRPWTYFLPSFKTILSYFFLCVKGIRIVNGHVIDKWARIAWKRAAREMDKSGVSASSKPYRDMYVRCCKVIDCPPEFEQLHRMSDEEYAVQIKSLVEEHGIVPALPKRFLEGDCGRFLQMLDGNGALLVSLLQENPNHYNKLGVHIFLTKSHVHPSIEKIIHEKSISYRLLTDGDCSVEKYMDVIFQYPVEDLDQRMLAHRVADICLEMRSESSSGMLRLLGRRIWDCYSSMVAVVKVGVVNRATVELLGKRDLSLAVVAFLYQNFTNYSEEEFSVIEQVLERCGILNGDSRSHVFKECIYRLLNDPALTIEWLDHPDACINIESRLDG